MYESPPSHIELLIFNTCVHILYSFYVKFYSLQVTILAKPSLHMFQESYIYKQQCHSTDI